MSSSASITIKPQDSRCRFWAKLLRAGVTIPSPSAVFGANDIPVPYMRNGDEELAPGDCIITGEEMHHRKARGWTYHIHFAKDDGTLVEIVNPGTEEKAQMKESGMPVDLLKGSGDVAACIRMLHALRNGWFKA